MKKVLLVPNLLFVFICFFISFQSGFTQWSNNPAINTTICNSASDQVNPHLCPDGSGGAIIAWDDSRNATQDVYVQRINSLGEILWTSNGIPAVTANFNQRKVEICSDGAGGAFIVWADPRSADTRIYAQRIRPDGVFYWQNNGIQVNSGNYSDVDNTFIKVIQSGAGVIVVWNGYTSSNTSWKLYTQRLDAFGNKMWNSGTSVILTNTSRAGLSFDLCKDGSDGAIVTWEDYRLGSSNIDIYAQKINLNGTLKWSTGVAICNNTAIQKNPRIVTDQTGGAYLAWEDYRNDYGSFANPNIDIYAQHVDTSGNSLLASNGTVICNDTTNQKAIIIMADGYSGASIFWNDWRNYNGTLNAGTDVNLYGQNLAFNGTKRWTANGKKFAVYVDAGKVNDSRYNANLVATDDLGGSILTWIGYGNSYSTSINIYAQRVDYNGNIIWSGANPPMGVLVSNTGTNFSLNTIHDGGSGGAIMVWSGRRVVADGYNIYTQRIKTSGILGDERVITHEKKDDFILSQNYPNPFNPTTNISFTLNDDSFASLKIYNAIGQEVAVLAQKEFKKGIYSFNWDAGTMTSGVYYYKLTAGTYSEIKRMTLIK